MATETVEPPKLSMEERRKAILAMLAQGAISGGEAEEALRLVPKKKKVPVGPRDPDGKPYSCYMDRSIPPKLQYLINNKKSPSTIQKSFKNVVGIVSKSAKWSATTVKS